MDPKKTAKMREFLAQAGARLSAATMEKIQTAIDTLEELLGLTEPDEAAVAQAVSSAQVPLVQAMVTGISVADTYEVTISRVARALRKDRSLPGDGRYSFYTHPSGWVAFEAYSWSDSWDESKTFIADYADDGTTITFSNVRDASIEQIIVVIDEAAEEAAIDLQRKQLFQSVATQTEMPAARVLCGTKGPMLLQTLPGSVHFQKRNDGRCEIQGIATHGNVPNRNNPPIVFPTECWASQLSAMQELIRQGKASGCFGHPQTEDGEYREPDPDEYAIRFTSLEQDGDLFPFKAITCSNTKGRELACGIDDGFNYDMSTVSFGKLKTQEWDGQSDMNVVQTEDFVWIRIADVVLQGASPGAEITDIRLQALRMGPHEEDATMTPEQIAEMKKLIQEAIAANDNAAVVALQAKIDSLEKTAGLTEEQETLLKQAAEVIAEKDAAKVLQARDAKIKTVVEALTQGEDKKFDPMFTQTAIGLFQQHASTAEDVDTKTDTVLQAMKPLMADVAILQSKGIYVPEYKGESKIHVNTPEEAIEDLVQTAVKQGKITDNGADDPSNMARTARLMLQSVAEEHQGYAVAHMMVRNGDIKGPKEARSFLQQNYRSLVQDIPTGAMTTSDVADAIPFVLPIIMQLLPQLVAARYCSIQPMTKSIGTIAYWKIKDQDGNLINERANFTGSYANDPGEKQTIKKLKGALTTENISPLAKKLSYDLSVEVIRRLRTDWGIDATAVMVAACAAEIAREWNYNDLANMVQGATATAVNYGTAPPTDDSFTGKEWQEQIIPHLFKARSNIRKKTSAATVSFIGDDDSIMRILWLAKSVGVLDDKASGQGHIAEGVNIVGNLASGGELVAVDWWDTLQENTILAIGQGDMWYKTGYVVAPYQGLYISPQTVEASTLDVEQGMLSEVAQKMVNGDYFCKITVQPGTAGTPL